MSSAAIHVCDASHCCAVCSARGWPAWLAGCGAMCSPVWWSVLMRGPPRLLEWCNWRLRRLGGNDCVSCDWPAAIFHLPASVSRVSTRLTKWHVLVGARVTSRMWGRSRLTRSPQQFTNCEFRRIICSRKFAEKLCSEINVARKCVSRKSIMRNRLMVLLMELRGYSGAKLLESALVRHWDPLMQSVNSSMWKSVICFQWVHLGPIADVTEGLWNCHSELAGLDDRIVCRERYSISTHVIGILA